MVHWRSWGWEICPYVCKAAKIKFDLLIADRSLVIDQIVDKKRSAAQGVAYFYFDYGEQNMQTPAYFVGSILRQLVVQKTVFPPPLLHFYQLFKEDDAHGSTSELVLILKDVCSVFDRCYIIVDALDECQKLYRKDILQILNDMNNGVVQIFVTSRPHSHDIKQHFKGTEQIKIEASEADIRTFCLRMIDENETTRDLADDDLREDIAETISKNARGMYVLASIDPKTLIALMLVKLPCKHR